MKDLSGPELAQLLRESFPEMNLAEFDNHLQPLSDADTKQMRADLPDAEHDRIYEDIINAHTSRCAALSGFAEQFLEWVRAGNEHPIRRALALIDQLLAATPTMPPGTTLAEADQYDFNQSLLACFLETALYLSPTPALRSLVLPNLGPAARAHMEEYMPGFLKKHGRN